MSENNLGNPHLPLSNNSNDGTDNVGTGQAPSLQSSQANHSFQPSPAQVNPVLQPSLALFNPTFQPFLEGLHRLGLELTGEQLDQFLLYQQELLDWNTHINLTSITKPEEVLIKHF